MFLVNHFIFQTDFVSDMINRFNLLSPEEKDNILNKKSAATSSCLHFSESQNKVIGNHQYKIEDCQKIIQLYYAAYMKDIQLINVFDFDKGEDLETTIIRALLNCLYYFFLFKSFSLSLFLSLYGFLIFVYNKKKSSKK